MEKTSEKQWGVSAHIWREDVGIMPWPHPEKSWFKKTTDFKHAGDI